jgi:hypothetical protein
MVRDDALLRMPMKALLLVFPLLVSNIAYAQSNDCSAIKVGAQRLACYDKANQRMKVEPQSKAKSAEAKPSHFRSHSWAVEEAIDQMTDKKKCTALYKGAWTIQASPGNFFVSTRGRGGVKAYTIRFNDEPAEPLQNATNIEKEISAADLSMYSERIYTAKRLRVEILTLVSGVVNEDIDLNGLNDAIGYIRSNCDI